MPCLVTLRPCARFFIEKDLFALITGWTNSDRAYIGYGRIYTSHLPPLQALRPPQPQLRLLRDSKHDAGSLGM